MRNHLHALVHGTRPDATFRVVSYIADNPVRAGLCATADAYPLFGSSKYSVAEILTALKELEPWKP
jgi:hypothetical protein